MKSEYHVAVAGATGAVGNEMLQILEEQEFPVASLKLLASSRSAGKTLDFRGESLHVEELRDDSFEGVDIALFSAGAACTTSESSWSGPWSRSASPNRINVVATS